MSRHPVMANLDYHEELSDAEADDGLLDDEVDVEAMREGTERVVQSLGELANLIPPKEIEQALWDSYYDADAAVAVLLEAYADEAARMNDASAEVLQGLGENSDKVTTKQIQDALWHYHYDVKKSIAYLDRTFINPVEKPKPKPKAPAECKYRSPSSSAGYLSRIKSSGRGRERSTTGSSHDYRQAELYLPLAPRIEVPAEWHFWDTPWLNVPLEKQSIFVAPARMGGLLGGSSGAPKLSKLQALAAARKSKKADGKKDVESAAKSSTQSPPSGGPSPGASKDNVKLDIRLRSRRSPRAGPDGLREGESGSGQEVPEGSNMDASVPPAVGTEASSHNPTPEAEACVIPQAPRPSAFASTLFGAASDNTSAPQSYPLPYTTLPTYSAKPFLQPSPDDIVLAAQSQAGKKFAAPAQKKAPKGTVAAPSNIEVEAVAEQMGKLSAKAEPRPKCKQIDVLEAYEKSNKDKKSSSFVVVGHVDAGKSTLMGRILLELKFVDKIVVERYRRQAEKIGKQSFALAWVMDQREEERDRGVTIDIATNHFETKKARYTILDAPGHKDFIPNMIAGTSQADFAILVVDASTGAFEKGIKGQTREHVLLLRALGVHRIIVAVNKMDMVGWSKDRFDEITGQVTGFLTAKGFLAKNFNFIPISGYNGDNLTQPSETPAASWYKGVTLIEALDNSDAAPRSLRRPFRMPISEIWKSPLGQITVSGRIDTGTTQVGEAFTVQPSGEEAYAKTIMVDSDVRDWAVAGENVSIFLTGIDVTHLRVGDIISSASAPIACSDTVRMKVMAFEHVMPMPIDLHRGRLHSAGRIQEMEAVLDKATGEVVKRRPKVIQPGEVARVVVKLGVKIPLEAGQRVVIRSSGETVAAGLVE
ncbi:related to translation elongation factor HBS1 protein [Cephalotrichum gorgonifer]|uniref:Elongation factor 1 alpha-like protein n=1 Tax=Cephalotrichum gorgonifer TaxID=2041049 RepID=A0AAE8N528_9PEZI|nr:related to translation elongation factor HBS1 protein [Cephalotrichum gorgonifer]